MSLSIAQRIDRVVWGDVLAQYGLPGRILAMVLRYLYAVLRDVFSGQLTLRSMSLVYSTLLSVVPLLAFSFSVLKGLGRGSVLESRLSLFLEPIGDKGEEITESVMSVVNGVNGSALGGVGLAIFVYTAISMVQKIEESFNYVWYVSKPRSFAKRFSEYALVLLIGPLFISIAITMFTTLQNDSAMQYLAQSEFLGPVLAASNKLTPYIIVAGMFTFLYTFIPNTKVNIRSALLGGVAGGFLWASVGLIFTSFIVNSPSRLEIYAGFAIPIVTLIWLYLNWLVLLIGSQLAFYHQNPAYLRVGRREPRLSNAMRERLAINIMFLVGTAFRNPEQNVGLQQISQALKIPTITLSPIAVGLEKAGLLTLTEKEDLQPGREMSRITLNDILDVVRVEGETGSHHPPRWAPEVDALGNKIDASLLETIGEKTLAELLDDAAD